MSEEYLGLKSLELTCWTMSSLAEKCLLPLITYELIYWEMPSWF